MWYGCNKYMPIPCFGNLLSYRDTDSTILLKSKSRTVLFLAWVTTSDPRKLLSPLLRFRNTQHGYIADLVTRRLQQVQIAWFDRERTNIIKFNSFTCTRSNRLQRHWFNLKRTSRKRINRLIHWIAKGPRERIH
jgi:hypothetical protein